MARNDEIDRTESSGASNSGMTTMLLSVAALTTIIGFGTFFVGWLNANIDAGEATLQIAAKQYALGHYTTAAKLAEQAVLPDDVAADLDLLREYVIGAAQINEALLDSDIRRRRTALHAALPRLKTASSKWPSGRADEGDRLLGTAYFEIGNFAQAALPLLQLVNRNPAVREEMTPMLAACYLHGDEQDAQLALDVINKLAEKKTRPSETDDALACLKAQCYLKLNRFDEARELLASVELRLANVINATPQTLELASKAKLLLAAVDVTDATRRFPKANQLIDSPPSDVLNFLEPAMERLAILRRDAAPNIINQSELWAARAQVCSGQPTAALNLFSNVRQQQPFEGINIAAGIEEIEMLAASGNGEEMLQTVRYLLREIGDEKNYDGSTIDLRSFRLRLFAAVQVLRSKQKFKYCVAIAKVMPSLFSLGDSRYEEGITYQQEAQRILAGSRRGVEIDPITLLAAKKKYRAAGDAFHEAAKLRFDDPTFCDTLWEAIDAYQSSGQFELCVELLDQYLRYEDRRRQPRALLALGKARLATGDSAKALKALEECVVEFPRDPLRYDARLYAALARSEAEEFEKARELLDQNLTDGGLTPESPVWQESLYSLGDLLLRQGNEAHMQWELTDASRDFSKPQSIVTLRESQPILEAAIVRLSEAAKRYWPDPRAKYAAYLTARAHRLAALWPKLESESSDALDAAKRQLRQASDQHLTAALNGFVAVRNELTTREEEQPLNASQSAMLRNCYIGEADTLFDLGQFEPAADAYRAVSLRYLDKPPALEAMLGQSRCLKELSRPREARLVIRQAIIVLNRIPPEADEQFALTTRYDRKRWEELLSWMDSGPIPEDSDA